MQNTIFGYFRRTYLLGKNPTDIFRCELWYYAMMKGRERERFHLGAQKGSRQWEDQTARDCIFLRCTKLIIAATGNEWDCVCLLWSVADDGEFRRGAVRSRGTRINIIIVWPETMPPSAALLLIIITFALHLTLTQVSSKHFVCTSFFLHLWKN